jgi:hypothetical protein
VESGDRTVTGLYGATAVRRVKITQECKNGCGMKVETLLLPGMVVPEPRECIGCISGSRALYDA